MRSVGRSLRVVTVAAALTCLGCGGDKEYSGPTLPPGESPTEKAINKAREDKKIKVGDVSWPGVLRSPTR